MVSHVKHSSKFDVWDFSQLGQFLSLYDDDDIVPIDSHCHSSFKAITFHDYWPPCAASAAHDFLNYTRIDTGLPSQTRSSRLFIYNKLAYAPLRVG